MKKHKKDIIYYTFIAIIAIAIMWAAVLGETKQEKVDCLQLQNLSQITPKWNPDTKTGFYLTQSESQMCASHNIIITAHVLQKGDLTN